MSVKVWAPPYVNACGGIRALHALCHQLRARDVDAAIGPMGGWNPSPYNAPQADGRYDFDVYPEIVFGNPGEGEQLIRWLLNRQRFPHPDDDLVYTWDPIFDSTAPRLQVPIIEDCFCPWDGERSGVVYWVGKGVRGPVPAGAVEITKLWPPSREGLARLLRTSTLLISFDAVTAINVEAVLCGVPVRIMADTAWDQDVIAHTDGARYGWAFDDNDLDRATAEVHLAYGHYHDVLVPNMHADIDRFAEAVAQ